MVAAAPQQAVSEKVPTVKTATVTPSADTALNTNKAFVHHKKWTDGSVSWDKLPESLSLLGKVIS